MTRFGRLVLVASLGMTLCALAGAPVGRSATPSYAGMIAAASRAGAAEPEIAGLRVGFAGR